MAKDYESILSDEQILDDGLSVSTDLDDYAPGSMAEITATGVAVGGSVTFEVDHVSGPGEDGVYGTADDAIAELDGEGHDSWSVTDGGEGDLDGEANGTIVTSWYVNPDDSIGETFLLSADDESQAAYASFTDSIENLTDQVISGVAPDPDGQVEINGAIFGQATIREGSGTGNYNTVLAVHGSDDTAEGFQTDSTDNTNPDLVDIDFAKTSTTLLSEMTILVIDGVEYIEYRVDLNEPNNQTEPLISLTEFKVYQSVDGTIETKATLELQTVVYDLDDGENSTLYLEDTSSGSGTDDYFVLIPVTSFDYSSPETSYVYLYVNMGEEDPLEETGGFEEWNILTAGGVKGNKFDDFNADGVWDPDGADDIEGNSDDEGPLQDVVIWIDLNDNGSFDASTDRYTTTDENGEYSFYGVPVGTYNIYEELDGNLIGLNGTEGVAEGYDYAADGWVRTTGPFETVTISDTGEIVTVDPIGNYFDRIDLSGYKWTDTDGDGVWDAGETGLGGITIVLDVDEINDNGNEIRTAITASDGSYSFDDITLSEIGVATTLYVYEELPTGGWEKTYGGYSVDVASGAFVTGTEGTAEDGNFANFEKFDLSGTKYTDANGDGLTDGDLGLGGVTIFIDVNDNGEDDDGYSVVTANGTTDDLDGDGNVDAEGFWAFTDLDAADAAIIAGAEVKEITPDGYVQTLGQLTGTSYTVTGTSGADQTGLDFANFEKFDLSGTKYTDANGDGLTDGDLGLGGVTIFIDVNDNGEDDDGYSVVTANGTTDDLDGDGNVDAEGFWAFTDLDAADAAIIAGAEVKEITPDGYVQTLGQLTGTSYTVTGTSGADQTGLDFANFEKFDLSGTKYTDANGDGLTDGDLGLGGVTIFIDVNDNGEDDDGYSVVTANGTTDDLDGDGNVDAEGFWAFTDLDAADAAIIAGAEVKEITPDGYVQTLGQLTGTSYTVTGTSGADQTGLDFANFEKFDLSGTKYTDANGDGLTDGDLGLGGVTIFIDVNDNGEDDDGYSVVTANGTTDDLDGDGNVDAEGFWAFTDLDAADAAIIAGAEVKEITPDGYVQTLGQLTGTSYTVTGTSGADQTGLDFANFEKFDLSGTKYTDANGDGLTDGDLGLGGVTIFIDVNDNGEDDDGYSVVTANGTTDDLDGDGNVDAEGFWAFTDLDAADAAIIAGAEVKEITPDGYVQTLGQLTGTSYTVTGTSGADQTGLDFANFEKFDLSGTKYTDANGDGLTDGDLGLGGVTIFIDVNDNGEDDDGYSVVTANGTTDDLDGDGNVDAEGFWAFTDLDAADAAIIAGAEVKEITPDGYVQTLGQLTGTSYTVTGTSGADQTGLDFANFEKFDLSGTKYTDANGDGLTDGDLGLGGVTIFIDVNDNGEDDDGYSVVTANGTTDDLDGDGNVDAEGFWAFTDLDAADAAIIAGAEVKEITPDGYVQTLGQLTGTSYTVTGTSGADQTGLDFANFEKFDLSGTKYTDANGDGLTDGDLGLGGVTIFIDVNDNGEDDDGYSVVTANGTTDDLDGDGNVDAEGFWAFTDLDAADAAIIAGAEVKEITPDGYVQTLGQLTGTSYTVTGTSGADQTGLDFANFEKFDLSGTKYTDANGDGLTDGDLGLGGVTIFIDVNDNGEDDDGYSVVTANGTTDDLDGDGNVDAEGFWAFTDLDAADAAIIAGAEVKEITPDGYVQTLGQLTGTSYTVTGTSGADQTGLDFANFEKFDLSGTKYTDANGDGLTDGDLGLGGVTIFIDVNDNGEDDDGYSVVTANGTTDDLDGDGNVDAEGFWAFTDLDAADAAIIAGAEVKEITPDGYVQTLGQLTGTSYTVTGTSGADQTGLDFANFEKFDLSGTKYTDANGDGLTDGDLGLGGVTIFIDVNDNGEDDDGYSVVTANGTTDDLDGDGNVDAEGFWAFTDLDAADAAIIAGAEVKEITPDGYVQTLGQLTGTSYTVTGTSGADQTGLDFANFEKFDLSGTKYTDANGDGLTDGDLGLGGVTIFIDVNDNGEDDDGYSVVTANGTTDDLDGDGNVDAEGFWAFTDLDAADAAIIAGAEVKEITPDGYVQTLGQLTGTSYTVTGTSGADQTGLDFANFEKFDLSGTKYTDANGDGLTDGDLGLGGVTIFIDVNDNGEDDDGYSVVTANGTTDDLDGDGNVDAEGFWAFTDLDAADAAIIAGAEVKEITPDGYVQTLGQLTGTSYTVTGTSGADQTGLDFANFEKFDLSGTKYTDANGDGLTDGDLGLGGVTIFIDVNDNGEDDDGYSVVTANGTTDDLDGDGNVDAEGFWAFTDLDAADAAIIAGAEVKEITPDGYVQTLGQLTGTSYTVTGTSGADQTGLDFANFEKFDLSGTKYTDANGDGLTDGDLGLGGVTIFIDVNDNGEDDDGYSVVTANGTTDDLDGDGNVDAEGFWAFTDLDAADAAIIAGAEVKEITPDGYVQTLGQLTGTSYTVTGTSGADQTGLDFANFEKFDLSGTKYTDANGDGLTDGDLGLGGVTIFIDVNDNGEDDDGYSVVTANGTTDDLDGDGNVDAEGFWAFTDLDAADAAIIAGAEVKEITPDGYVQTLGQLTGTSYTVTGTSGADQTGLDFANFEKFDLSGTKYTDANGDGLTDGDLGLGGVTIFIDVNDNGEDDDGYSVVTANGTTDDLDGDGNVDAEGFWAFTDLDAADAAIIAGAEVKEITPDGYVQTLGQLTGTSYTVTGTSGADQTGLDFANFEKFDLSGTKYTDANGDGLTDGDLGLGGVTIFIDVNDNGEDDDGYSVVTANGTTDDLDGDGNVDAEGFWAFTDLDAADAAIIAGAEVKEITPDGYVQTLGQLTGTSYTVTGTSGADQTGLDFANFELIDLSGYKWADITGDGVWDAGETGLGGFTIVLDDDEDPTNGTIRTTTTDLTDGSYSFADITLDEIGDATTLYVYEAPEEGFVQTYGGYSVDVASGALVAGDSGETEEGNFGNQMLEGANRTPGFWQSRLGQSFYDGIDDNQGDANGDGFPDGSKNFDQEGWCEEDLLTTYGIDTNGDLRNDSFLIWDEDGNGELNGDDIALTSDELLEWVSGGTGRGQRDFVEILQRDLAATYLNTLNNSCLAGLDKPFMDSEIEDSYALAIQFYQDENGNKKAQKSAWSNYGSDAHKELDAYNNNGEILDEEIDAFVQIRLDGDDFGNDTVQNWLVAESLYEDFYA